MKSFLAICTLFTLLNACGYSNTELNKFETQIKAYNRKYKLDLNPTGSGLYLKIDSLGSGRPIQVQDSVWVSYTLKLLSGKIIEMQDQGVGLPLSELIKGWQEALFNLPVGSQLHCIVPPQLGYGQGGTDKIGKDKILYFKMKVIDAK
jgi:FKBP-type peptidyl-prolyl cis-trans isomerase FkpA